MTRNKAIERAIAILSGGLDSVDQHKDKSWAWRFGSLEETAQRALEELRAAAEPEAKVVRNVWRKRVRGQQALRHRQLPVLQRAKAASAGAWPMSTLPGLLAGACA